MKIIVLVKQVPDTTEVKIDEKTGTMIREGVPSILNPFDQFALEEAVRVKESVGGEITVITLGPDQARSALMKCLALGADRAVHLSDWAFAGADTLATALSLYYAIKKAGEFDLILCGQMALDGETGHVGPEVSAFLDIPQITYVEKIEELGSDHVTVKSLTDEGYRIVEAKLPTLVACIPPAAFEYSNPSMSGIIKARSKPYVVWKVIDIGCDKDRCGLKGSPTRVIKTFSPPVRAKGVIYTEHFEEAAKKIVEKALEEKVI